MSDHCHNCYKTTKLNVCWECLEEGSVIIGSLEKKLKAEREKNNHLSHLGKKVECLEKENAELKEENERLIDRIFKMQYTPKQQQAILKNHKEASE
jgi:dsDNA-specific endonuclease/ATPase MutS2